MSFVFRTAGARRPRTGLVARLFIVLFCCASAGFAAAQAEVEEGGGAMRWRDPSSGTYAPALTQSSRVELGIAGMLARVRLEQTFHNQTDQWQEGVYSFPLPPDAAVRHLEMRAGERVIIGEVREREEAANVYREARAAGKKAALVEQQRPNLFTTRIANVAPGEQVSVRLEYVQQAQYAGGEFSLRVPTTLTPRYIPGVPLAEIAAEEELAETVPLSVDEYFGWARATTEVPDAAAITPLQYRQPGSDSAPLNPVSFDVDLDAGMPLARVEALYHRMNLSRDGERYHLVLADGVAEMDRDFELRWRPVTGATPRAALFTEAVDGEYYGLLMVLPPALAADQQVLPREMIFVVDTSGSMGGEPIRQAQASLQYGLAQLRPGDSFNIIAFESTTRALFNRAQPVSETSTARARAFVQRLQAGGGTEMLPALQRALSPQGVARAEPEERGQRLRQVVFITDGAVGNEQALFAAIQRELGDSRLFTVGIGSAPNQWFMQRAADAGRGFSVQVGRIEEVGERMASLFERISAPLARELRVQWPVAVEAWPARVPDLYRGEPLVQAVHFGSTPPAGEIEVHGRLAGQAWRQSVSVPALPGAQPHSGVASVWARRKIANLMAQPGDTTSAQETRAAVLEVALAHQLLSPYTSFVAVEQQLSRDPQVPLRAGAVPNTRPQGQSAQPYAYPNTATSARAKVLLASLLLLLGLLVHVMRQPEPLPHAAA
ncbi:marine proteobacterial sortase target protein [Mangrovimicrobium sediminis]|uniref:Marine proteobacterial sortase target protein n=1 Tax=Mangrovimicrobium sediminis TaxID=2562682 RepID=A0A4Z0M1X8_9GAMM|nr:marine proteobacterial sortase target protein [Haliea sp. SAOS-164]TGD73529.1 marine proteobacterial sortase target protein [Haliea sp. SAOS-164]